MNFKPKTFTDKQKTVSVFHGLCKGCGICIEVCPQKALRFSDHELGFHSTPSVEVNVTKCIACGICEISCPDCALRIDKNGPV